MSSTVRLGIFATSLLVTIALVWGGPDLAMLFVRWASEHESAANVIRSLAGSCSLIAGKWDSQRSRLSGSTYLPVSRFSSRSTMKVASSCCQTSWVPRCISGSNPNRGHGITTSFVPAGTSFRRWRNWSWGRKLSRLRLPPCPNENRYR
jgi:hypothetical protein